MKTPPRPETETARLRALRALQEVAEVSVGLVHYDPSAHASVEDLLAEADALRYAAKRSDQGGESPSGG